MDLLLVTTLVHFEGPQQSGWAALYVLVIAVYALIMPLRSGVVTALLGAAIFLADAYFGHPGPPGTWLWGQVAVFTVVFLVVAILGQRLRTASVEQTELAIELHRVRLEADEILRNIRSGVITVDGQGSLAFLNLAAEHLLGLSAAEHLGLPVLDALEERAPELWAAIVTGIRKGRRVNRAEGTARRADGREVPIGLSTTTFERPSESLPSVTAIFTDISDLQQLQALHVRAERLEAVAALSASLAHEIRNPLASIRSSVEQLARSVHDDPDDRVLARPDRPGERPAEPAAGRIPRFLPGPRQSFRHRGSHGGGPRTRRSWSGSTPTPDPASTSWCGALDRGRSRRGSAPPHRDQPVAQRGAGDERERDGSRRSSICPGPASSPGQRVRPSGAAPGPGRRPRDRSRAAGTACSSLS